MNFVERTLYLVEGISLRHPAWLHHSMDFPQQGPIAKPINFLFSFAEKEAKHVSS